MKMHKFTVFISTGSVEKLKVRWKLKASF